MALIKCSECTKEISSKASACPQCGAPVSTPQSSEPVTTIQETGKSLKIQQAFAILLMFSGMFGCMADANGTGLTSGETSPGFWIFLAGGIWLIIVRLNTWWKHG